LLNSLPQKDDADTDAESPVSKDETTSDPQQAQLEKREYHRFLLAKSFFDCREYDRCASVFLPNTRPRIPVTPAQITPSKSSRASKKGKEKVSSSPGTQSQSSDDSLARISHKALFLSLYSKYLAGEKRKDEESEMILGPADGGVTVNKELAGLIRLLGTWLEEREIKTLNGGGWLEYLYAIFLSKNKNEDLAKEWFLKSVHLYPFNWGAWQELSNLLNNSDEVCSFLCRRM
jgi:anaphase-promoting complex subunit 8